MFLKSSKGNINLSVLIFTFLICIAIALGVAFFHHYNSPSKFLEYKFSDISEKLAGASNFPSTANNILNSDKSVSYIKLLDRNGVLEESFGNVNLGNTKRFTISGPSNKTIVLGLNPPTNLKLDTYLLVWSLLIGSALSLILILFAFMKPPSTPAVSTDSMTKLIDAMNKVSDGDYRERIDVSSSTMEDISIINTYQSFNRMTESLKNKYATDVEIDDEEERDIDPINTDESGSGFVELTNGTGNNVSDELTHGDADVVLMNEPGSETEVDDESEPKIVFNEITDSEDESGIQSDDVEFDLGADMEDEQIFTEQDDVGVEETQENLSETEQLLSDTEAESESGEELSPFKPKIVLPKSSVYPKDRNVTVVVAKIDNFQDLTERLNSSDLSLFLTQYRKSASQIISSYGGVIEALLQDEIVAIFNAPDEQIHPELRAICASVEVLHELATMAKKRRNEGKELIAGKIGVGVQALEYYSETGVPDSVKNVIKDARFVCENANLWKVYVTSKLHNLVNDNVDAKEYLIDGEVLYSITGVEQGVVERDNIT